MIAPSKPILIALAGVVGLGVVIGGVVALRMRARPLDMPSVTAPTSPVASEGSVRDTTTEPVLTNEPSTTIDLATRDTDGDGLMDQEELRIGTSLTLRDTDGDDVSDYDEVRVAHTDPLVIPKKIISPAVDNLVMTATTTVVSPSSNADTDGDGLRDQDEVLRYLTKPTVADTDGDGYSDGAEVQNGYDPRGPGKCAKPTCLP